MSNYFLKIYHKFIFNTINCAFYVTYEILGKFDIKHFLKDHRYS